jgi:GT2 family glycosyltransferase/glycosyltransferase involved in cell wall biosynthesis
MGALLPLARRMRRIPDMHRPISIVIPVYNAREMTLRCVATVLEHGRGAFRLIVVDDCSTDAALSAELRQIAERDKRVVFLRNDVNLGFVGTANAGMRAAGDDDVLLLNSDTEVFEGFLERIAACAYGDATTGVVSPFSNNATLCSVPLPFRDNPIPEGLTPAQFDKLIEACSLRERPEIPTAVGFCMFIRREVLRETGLFNLEIYGRGFGEENDLCELAKEAGWKIRLADDVFVYHKGKASFGAEGHEREARNLAILEGRHPGYIESIHRFIADNPLGPLHDRIRLQLRRGSGASRPALLFVLHKSPWAAMPGGTEFHVLDLVRHLKLQRAVVAYPDGTKLVAAEVFDGDADDPVFYRFPLQREATPFILDDAAFALAFRRMVLHLGVVAAHVHHLLHWPVEITGVLEEAGIPFVFTAHDYFSVCPNWNLFDGGRNAACPCDGSASCFESCLPAFFATVKAEAPLPAAYAPYRNEHRAAFAKLYAGAARAVFPSHAALREVAARQPLERPRCEVIGHGYDAPAAPEDAARSSRPRPPLRLLVLGEVGAAVKGRDNYVALVEATRELSLEWHFVGHTPEAAIKPRLEERGLAGRAVFHGRVERGEVLDVIARIDPDAGVLMPACHETFSYVVSELFVSAVAILTNDMGAPPERVREHGGWVVGSVAEAAAKLAQLVAEPELIENERERLRGFRHQSLQENADRHRTLYERAGLAKGLTGELRPDPRGIADLAAHWADARPRPPKGQVAAFAHAPDPDYQKRGWYRAFLQLKPLIPAGARRYGRDLLLRYQYRTVRVLRPDREAQASGVTLLKRGLAETTWRVQDGAAQFVFTLDPLATSRVKLLRFRMLQEADQQSSARIYWTHAPGEAFDDKRSTSVELNGRAGVWGEYLLRLDTAKLGASWRAGERIHRLRFDPIDRPGVISLGPIELGG